MTGVRLLDGHLVAAVDFLEAHLHDLRATTVGRFLPT